MSNSKHLTLEVRNLGQRAYTETWQAMKAFTDQRDDATHDQVWFVEHPPVFTQGVGGKPEHVLNPGDIPIVQSDRGGQVTYHGPGQLVMYVLINLRRHKKSIRDLVDILELSTIGVLAQYGIQANAKRDAPGVYVDGKKIASLGLRVRKGCSYHGLSLNVNMDTEPFTRINPCGYQGLEITQLSQLGVNCQPIDLASPLLAELAQRLNYRNTVAYEPVTDQAQHNN